MIKKNELYKLLIREFKEFDLRYYSLKLRESGYSQNIFVNYKNKKFRMI